MSTAGYHVGHRTQGSVVMYLNSGDTHTQHENTTHFSFTFKDAIHPRAGEGVAKLILIADSMEWVLILFWFLGVLLNILF